ncbi:glucose-6-phosphate dehydrogenase assembly protein OpcA [Corynebacterium sp. TAE3-ERU12]|uniref:glucose-6-phosphate dehydrogenase assembly protein OpcA n=1 Tax=Corynebacterium sp. TAE3-ERU12 TaxID=2849491 RepID=UPI001C44B1F6|nr:glucose-6-phosphate dehydrogenase assembly protein OpcA [Corynebacterium sp. TAE3-ERU12]MBV7295414.1 glucose-6-phosphate dehydrogenase assembly protein OpcA [Corynebacterium sp. TAE3-ERU12]
MIITLTDSDTRDIARELVRRRDDGGMVTTGRVLTLVVLADGDDDLESIIATANEVSREHPARVLMLVSESRDGDNRLDAEIRLGGDAGVGEIIVMHLAGKIGDHPEAVVMPLLLPDTPVVAWWPTTPPVTPSETEIGALAQRRITDMRASKRHNPLEVRRNAYRPGDSDLCWSRLTAWRGVLASVLDLPPHEPITGVTITGAADNPSVDLAAGWLADRLSLRVRRTISEDPAANDPHRVPVTRVHLQRPTRDIVVETVDEETAQVCIGDRPPFRVAVSARPEVDCLAEELRHLDPDQAYARALRGLSRVDRSTGVK